MDSIVVARELFTLRVEDDAATTHAHAEPMLVVDRTGRGVRGEIFARERRAADDVVDE